MVSATSSFSAPAWSPDGHWIVYEKRDNDPFNTSIEIRSVDGGTSATVLSKPPLPNMVLLPHANHPLTFSRNWELFFVGIEAPEFLSGRASLWRMRIDPRKPGNEQPRRLAEWADLDFASFSASLDGGHLAVSEAPIPVRCISGTPGRKGFEFKFGPAVYGGRVRLPVSSTLRGQPIAINCSSHRCKLVHQRYLVSRSTVPLQNALHPARHRSLGHRWRPIMLPSCMQSIRAHDRSGFITVNERSCRRRTTKDAA